MPKRILTVCLGNICRSPLAEGILRQKIADAGLDWEVDSAGTGAWHVGNPPDPRSIAVARKNGLDIAHQRARQFLAPDFAQYDHILVMDASNYQNVLRLARSDADRARVEMIMNYADPGRNQAVPDPYWNDDGFDQVYAMLDRAAERFVAAHA